MSPSTLAFPARVVTLAVVLAACAAAASEPQLARTDAPQMVTVRGCVVGSRLEPAGENPASSLFPDATFALKGNRELLSQLRKQHAGHLEEVTGLVVLPRGPREDSRGAERKLGNKTKVIVGARTREGGDGQPVQFLTLTVKAFQHVADRCVSRK